MIIAIHIIFESQFLHILVCFGRALPFKSVNAVPEPKFDYFTNNNSL